LCFDNNCPVAVNVNLELQRRFCFLGHSVHLWIWCVDPKIVD